MSFEIYKIGLNPQPESYTNFLSLSEISTSSRSFIPPCYILLHFLILVEFPILFTLAPLQDVSCMWTSAIIKAIAGKCYVPYLGQWIANMSPYPKQGSRWFSGQKKILQLIFIFMSCFLNLHFERMQCAQSEVLKHGHKFFDISLMKR